MILAFFFSMFFYCVLFSPIYFVVRFLIVKRSQIHWWKELLYYSFFIYSVSIFSQTILPSKEFLLGNEIVVGRSNFSLFQTISLYVNQLGGPMHSIAMYNLVGNIVLFIPFGFYIPVIWYTFRSLWKMLIVSFAIPIFIESTQYFIGRSIDVDDVFLNTIAIVMGYCLYKIAKWLLQRNRFRLSSG